MSSKRSDASDRWVDWHARRDRFAAATQPQSQRQIRPARAVHIDRELAYRRSATLFILWFNKERHNQVNTCPPRMIGRCPGVITRWPGMVGQPPAQVLNASLIYVVAITSRVPLALLPVHVQREGFCPGTSRRRQIYASETAPGAGENSAIIKLYQTSGAFCAALFSSGSGSAW